MKEIKFSDLPDVCDGLTQKDRIVLFYFDKLQKELNGQRVPVAMLYGRVLEHMDISSEEFQSILKKLTGN